MLLRYTFCFNLLPEETMRHYLAERTGVNPAREFFLLWVLGQDVAGAITLEPADGEALPPNVHQDIDAVPENEYSMIELARMLGMNVPETQLLSINQVANIPP